MGLVADFLADCARAGLREDTTILRYRETLAVLERDCHLNLDSCSRQELVEAFDYLRTSRTRLGKPRSSDSYNLHVTVVKMALTFGGREDLADVLQYVRGPDRKEKIVEKLIPAKDRERLIREANGLQERLIFELLDETRGRRGELYKLRIRDVQFETVEGVLTAIINLTGKTGTGLRRVFYSAPDLRDHINNHPHKEDPNARLLLDPEGKPMTYRQFYYYIGKASERIVGYKINPHRWRHSGCTDDAKHFTDQEMMKLNRWKTAQPCIIYSHLSLRDVDDKDLVLHGLKNKEEILRPIMQVQRCGACKHENAPIAVYCSNCGLTLAQSHEDKRSLEFATLREEVQDLKFAIRMLQDGSRASQPLVVKPPMGGENKK